LVTVPVAYQEFAVLVEPLSVVEKAVSSAFRLHPGAPSTALVLGAGAVGLLSAMVLRNRGLDVTVLSLEPEDSERARLAREAGAEYVCSLADRVFDVVIEAAGAPAAALVALKAIGPAGVFVVLGVTESVEVPMLPLILRNQVVAGSVNAAPRDFIAAVEDLARFPAKVLSRMIAREPWDTFRSTLLGPLSGTPKVVHVWT
jgi:threonine dehydrogenase-like Zn-dependent dehydrogenase